MKYSVDKHEKLTIFSLSEENLNSGNAPVLKSQLIILFNEGVTNLILDLSAVKFVDSSGLSAILTGNRLWSDGQEFILTGVDHPSVKKLIEISRLGTVLKIIPTISEARDYVYMNELEKELMTGSDTDSQS